MPDLKNLEVLFSTSATDGARFVASRLPGSAKLGLGIEDGERLAATTLDAEQACALALSILAAQLEALPAFAARVEEGLAMRIAAALLAPAAERGLLAHALAGREPS